ncbi:hypothetical protein D3C84_696050 [compost metagenome]
MSNGPIVPDSRDFTSVLYQASHVVDEVPDSVLGRCIWIAGHFTCVFGELRRVVVCDRAEKKFIGSQVDTPAAWKHCEKIRDESCDKGTCSTKAEIESFRHNGAITETKLKFRSVA